MAPNQTSVLDPTQDADARIIRAYQRVALLWELLRCAQEASAREEVTFSDQVIYAMADDCHAAMTALEPLLEWNGGYPGEPEP